MSVMSCMYALPLVAFVVAGHIDMAGLIFLLRGGRRNGCMYPNMPEETYFRSRLFFIGSQSSCIVKYRLTRNSIPHLPDQGKLAKHMEMSLFFIFLLCFIMQNDRIKNNKTL